ncbi:MAG: pyrrolysine--tRNA(Pyl) ligase small subunit [Methermicoccaceae archaeon]
MRRQSKEDNESPFRLAENYMLWPSRSGLLHELTNVELKGRTIIMHSKCGQIIMANNSRRSRAARWLRHKWFYRPCKRCKVSDERLTMFGGRMFRKY